MTRTQDLPPTRLPPIASLKLQARRLRAALAAEGNVISHSQALELVATQQGFRDWNTLNASAPREADTPGLSVGDAVTGRYLGCPFTGRVVSLSTLPGGKYRTLDIAFDSPVDVVRFDSFSAFRRRISATIDKAGRSPTRTSDGMPHLELSPA